MRTTRAGSRRAFVTAVALVTGGTAVDANAQTAEIRMSADPNRVTVGDTFGLQIRIDATGGEPEEATLPNLDAFRIIGRRVSRPIQFSFGFGGQAQTLRVSTVYDFTLQAVRPGTFTINPPRVRMAGRPVRGEPVTIVVEEAGSVTSSPAPSPLPGKPPPATTAPVNGEVDSVLFLRAVADKARAVVGEQVTFTIYLYVAPTVSGRPEVTREASTEGFWVQDLLPVDHTGQRTTDLVDGTPYEVHVVRRFAGFPLHEGTLELGPMTVEMSAGSIIDRFMGGGSRLSRASPPVRIEVQPLPADGRPEGEVLVGRYELTAALDSARVHTGNAALLTATVHGSGNLNDVDLVSPSIDGVTVHAPQVRDVLESPGDLVGGTRTVQWLLVPDRPGTFTIPAFRLWTFDPVDRRYKPLETTPLALESVGTAPSDTSAPSPPTVTPQSPEPAASAADGLDRLATIRPGSALRRGAPSLASHSYFGWLLAGPGIGFAAIGATLVARARLRRRRERTAPLRVGRAAQKRLAAAVQLVDGGDAKAFFAEITRVMTTLLEAKLGEPVGGLTRSQLRRQLSGRGFDESRVDRIVEELEHAEYGRFSAAASAPLELLRTLERVQAVCTAIDAFTPDRMEART